MRKFALILLAAAIALPAMINFSNASDPADNNGANVQLNGSDFRPTESDWTIYYSAPDGSSLDGSLFGGVIGFSTTYKINGNTQAESFKNNPGIEKDKYLVDESWISSINAESVETAGNSIEAGYYSFSTTINVTDVNNTFLSGAFQVYGTLVGVAVNGTLIYDVTNTPTSDNNVEQGYVESVSYDSDNSLTTASFVNKFKDDGTSHWKDLLSLGDNILMFIVANHAVTPDFSPDIAENNIEWGDYKNGTYYAGFVGISFGEINSGTSGTDTPDPDPDPDPDPTPDPTATPEPTTLAILACGILGGGLAMRRRKN